MSEQVAARPIEVVDPHKTLLERGGSGYVRRSEIDPQTHSNRYDPPGKWVNLGIWRDTKGTDRVRLIAQDMAADEIREKLPTVEEFLSWQQERAHAPEAAEVSSVLAQARLDMGSEATATQVAVAESDHNSEKERHLDRIFAPILRPEADQSDDAPRLDFLFMDEGPEMERQAAEYSAHSQKMDVVRRGQANYDKFVTKEAIADAENQLGRTLRSDHGIAEILQRHGMSEYDLNAATTALREQNALRREVGVYLLEKLEKLAISAPGALPFRIRVNSQKSPGDVLASTNNTMRSREYAALLALSMLDGSFNHERASSDQIEHGKDGEVILGQHRSAARMLLY